MLLYRFNNIGAFPLLATYTTARNPISLQVRGEGDEVGLVFSFERHPTDSDEVAIVLRLPFVTIDGNPQRLELQFSGDLHGCRAFVEAADSHGTGLVYAFRGDDDSARQTWMADIQSPSDVWGRQEESGARPVVLPLQLYRFGIAIGAGRRKLALRLLRMSVTGDVHLGPSGIAGVEDPSDQAGPA